MKFSSFLTAVGLLLVGGFVFTLATTLLRKPPAPTRPKLAPTPVAAPPAPEPPAASPAESPVAAKTPAVPEGDPLLAPPPDDFDAFVEESLVRMRAGEAATRERWGVGLADRFVLDQQRGTLAFLNTDRGYKRVEARAQVIGSFNASEKSWMWAWANESLARGVTTDARALRDYGEAHGFAQLSDRGWDDAKMDDGWRAAALALRLCRADAVYRAPSTDGRLFVFLALRDIRRIE